MLSLVKAVRNGTEIENPRAWLRLVASRSAFRKWNDSEIPLGEFPDSEDGPTEDYILTRLVLYDLIKEIPDEQRQAFLLHLEGYQSVEIAILLGKTSATVRSNIRYARKRLQASVDWRE